jgi:hypothetical protein
MVNKLSLLLDLVTGLGKMLKDVFLALFFFNYGKDEERLKSKEKEVKDAKESGKLRNTVSGKSDDDLRSGLRDNKR